MGAFQAIPTSLPLSIYAGIWRKSRSVQPFHLMVEFDPQECALFTEHVAPTLEAILLMYGVQRIPPWKCRRRFELSYCCFQPRTNLLPLLARQRIAFGGILGE